MAATLVLTDRELNVLRGKTIVGVISRAEVARLFARIDAIELLLDEADNDDVFGTEGWRHRLGIED